MPLVSKSIIERWYQTDSWVYRNFSYWFKNPLWDKRIPNGFSLCPYFWLSIFSLFLVRPLVGAVLGFRFAVSVIGVGKAITWLDNKISGGNPRVPHGAPTLALLIAIAVVIAGVYGIGILAVAIWTACSAAGCLPALILPLVLATVTIVCGLYRAFNRDSDCKVENYVRVTAVVCVALAFWLMPAEAIIAFTTIPLLLWHGVCSIFVLLGYVLTSIPGWVVIGATYAWLGIKIAVLWCVGLIVAFCIAFSTAIIVSIISLISLSIFGWGANKWYVDTGRAEAAKKEREHFKKIEDLFQWVVRRVAYHDECHSMSREWENSKWAAVLRYRYPYAMKSVEKAVERDREIPEKVMAKIYKECLELKVIIIKEEKEAARIRHEQCKKLTEKAGVVATPIANGACATWNGVVWAIHFLFVRVIWFVMKEIGTFFVLLWKLFWAWKKGACPYYQFATPVKPQEIKSEHNSSTHTPSVSG